MGRTKWLVMAVTMVGGIATMSVAADSAEAANRCKRVTARIVTQITTENCTSPVLLCTAGTLSHAGHLNGATTFTTLGVSPGAGLAPLVPATTLSYTGQLTITTRRGSLVLTDVGLLEQSTLRFTELDTVVSGTGEFAGHTGHWTISGDVTGGGTGFDGRVEGDLCPP